MAKVAVAAVVLSCVVSLASAVVFPGKTWIRKEPEDEGLDSFKLADAFLYAQGLGGETACVSVHRNGYLLADSYWMNTSYASTTIIFSVSKAWTATLIGTAERDGKLSTSDLMGKYVPEWASKADTRNITMEHVMRHNSGRYYDEVADFVTPQTLGDQNAYSIGLPQAHPPGTVDQYNQMAYQMLQAVIERSTGQGVMQRTMQELIGPLQFESHTYWQMQSFFLNVPQKYPLVYGGVTTSCADLARFGWLWANNGTWNGHQVFTQQFFDKAMSQPTMPFGKARRYGNFGGGPNVKSEGLGKNIVVFNQRNGMVFTRIGMPTTLLFNVGTFIDKVMAAIKNPLLRGEKEDWIVAY